MNDLFHILNEFKLKNCQLQSFITFKDLKLSFWYFLHLMLFTKFEFWILEVLTYFSLRRWFQIKKNSTTKLFNFWRSTTFILVFFSFDIVVVILFTNLISLIYSFWNYIRELLILWTNLLSLFEKIKDLYKNCRSYEVTQLCRWKLLHLNLFSGSKLDLKIIFAVCQIFDTRQRASLPSVENLLFAECQMKTLGKYKFQI